MSESGPAGDSVQVALFPDKAVVRIVGRGSFHVSTSVKDFGREAARRGARELIFDLRQCIGMDSTFMGVTAGLAFYLRKADPPGRVIMLNLSPKTRNLLKTLGLDQVVETHMQDEDLSAYADVLRREEELETVEDQADRAEKAETALDAHRDLVELTPENKPKFKDVIAFLEEDVAQNRQNEPDGP